VKILAELESIKKMGTEKSAKERKNGKIRIVSVRYVEMPNTQARFEKAIRLILREKEETSIVEKLLSPQSERNLAKQSSSGKH